ncbi:MAG: putative Ig domain-containing protein, partial [Bacteroidales bacterium]|nr:putative Ig domain-containing protein [Bacteroidales bacterium]
AFSLTINATDPDNNSLTYSASGLPSGAVFAASTRTFTWTPGNDQSGTYQVTFRVSDGSLSDSETVALAVANGNAAPILNAIGAQAIGENSLLTFEVSASDANGDNLVYSASGLPAGAVFNGTQRRFSWTPGYSQAGSYSVLFTVTDGVYTDSEPVSITVSNINRAPVISGTPGGSVMATGTYSFTPVASDPDGDTVTFSIVNKPVWAVFDTATGKLNGSPSESQVGNNPGILISANDGHRSTPLTAFTIEVTAYVHQDTDGDGVPDYQDAFPDDSSEWIDTDGDRVGNNSDADDDNDGVIDTRDGYPLDAASTGWVISAHAGAGGYISPDGEASVDYGESKIYRLTPMAGYYI